MEWTMEYFPLEMNDLKPQVRQKAIEIANKLISDGRQSDPRLIRQAIAQAEEWFLNLEG